VDKIRLSFQNSRFEFGGRIITVTASFGITEYYNRKSGVYYSFDEMVSIADAALYKAKANGRNQFVAQVEES
jgi:GGDEF domain-containing protein